MKCDINEQDYDSNESNFDCQDIDFEQGRLIRSIITTMIQIHRFQREEHCRLYLLGSTEHFFWWTEPASFWKDMAPFSKISVNDSAPWIEQPPFVTNYSTVCRNN